MLSFSCDLTVYIAISMNWVFPVFDYHEMNSCNGLKKKSVWVSKTYQFVSIACRHGSNKKNRKLKRYNRWWIVRQITQQFHSLMRYKKFKIFCDNAHEITINGYYDCKQNRLTTVNWTLSQICIRLQWPMHTGNRVK